MLLVFRSSILHIGGRARCLGGLRAHTGSGGCAELGVVTDGTSISYGKPSRGRLIDGVRLADKGEGFTTREIWQKRGNRYGTDELVDLVVQVSRRVAMTWPGTQVTVGALTPERGGPSQRIRRGTR